MTPLITAASHGHSRSAFAIGFTSVESAATFAPFALPFPPFARENCVAQITGIRWVDPEECAFHVFQSADVHPAGHDITEREQSLESVQKLRLGQVFSALEQLFAGKRRAAEPNGFEHADFAAVQVDLARHGRYSGGSASFQLASWLTGLPSPNEFSRLPGAKARDGRGVGPPRF